MKSGLSRSWFEIDPVREKRVFRLEGFCVWCGTMLRGCDGKFHLYFSFWPREKGFEAWVTHSRIGHAVAETPGGEYRYSGSCFPPSPESAWDRDVMHNPAVLAVDGRYYLYYTGNYGDGSYYSHRNNQRVGVAVAESPEGPWRRFPLPLLSPEAVGPEYVLTTNPSACRLPDGRFLLIYKAVLNRKPGPFYGPVIHNAAFSDSPEGPFETMAVDIFSGAGRTDFAGEDPFVFVSGGRIYAILKDQERFYYREAERSLVLWESPDGLKWRPAEKPLVMTRSFNSESGPEYFRVERPYLYLENGRPKQLFTAVKPSEDSDESCNIHCGVEFRPEPEAVLS
ncbi:MAG: sucrase [Lentisphaeria bacterium]|nr:sucrase [Lentisphaeria bacterium]